MKIIIAVFLFILSLFLIGQNLNKPFWGVHDWNGARYGNIARNYLKYGLFETKFGQVENSGTVTEEEFKYYTHYPPLLPIIISLSYKVFGISEWSTRLIPLLSTSASISLIFLIGLRLFNMEIGLVAATMALLTPMTQYFGKNASHEPLTLFFILLSFYGYISIGKLKHAKIIFSFGLILAELTAWAGYFLLVALTLTHIFRKESDRLKKLIPYWILSVILFGSHIFHVNMLTGSPGGGNLFDSLLQRSGLSANVQPPGFNLPNYLNQLRLWFSTQFSLTLTFLALLWLAIKRLGINNDWPIATLGLIGLIYTIFFSSSVFIHNYLLFYFLPFLTLAGAGAIFWLRGSYDRLVYHNKLKGIYLKLVPTILILFTLVLIKVERHDFLKALKSSDQERFAVEAGREIRRHSDTDDLVLVIPESFIFAADNFLKFYSDRKLVYSDQEVIDYDVKILIDQIEGKFEIIKR